jgi:hypothetical protein
MPIVDAQVVVSEGSRLPTGTANSLAEALAGVFGAAPGRVWVRLAQLNDSEYAENGTNEPVLPVFLKVLHADAPEPSALAVQASEVAHAVGACLGRGPELVHVEYAAPGRGRVAFGGKLLR